MLQLVVKGIKENCIVVLVTKDIIKKKSSCFS